jgi:hypothetical protein
LLVSHELEAEAGEALVRTTVSPPLQQAMLAINRGESRETPDMAALREQADVQQTVRHHGPGHYDCAPDYCRPGQLCLTPRAGIGSTPRHHPLQRTP